MLEKPLMRLVSPVSMRSQSVRFPVAARNSRKLRGWRSSVFTFPTGYPLPSCTVMPRSEPAAATAYPGAPSQKYLREVSAFGHAWISSRTMRVPPSDTTSPVSNWMAETMRGMS